MSQIDAARDIRWLHAREADKLRLLETRCYKEPWSLDLIRQSLEAPMTYGRGLYREGELAAYTIFQLIFEEAHLLNIAVSPDFRRQGLGRQLMEDLHSEAIRQGARFVYLEVRPSNLPARELYKAFSYRQIGEREGYYADGEKAFVLAKALGVK